MTRYKLTVAYDGTDFHGWQRQVTAEGRVLRTVQGVLEATAREVLGLPGIDVVGASRTDAGVHALGQVAAFSAETSIPLEKLPAALTSRLPDDVHVRHAAIVHDDFDPIAHAVRKCYRYSIAHGGPETGIHQRFHLPPLFDRRFVWFTFHPLDVAAMNQAAQHLLGEHDFTSFAQINHGRQSPVRSIFSCSVRATAIDRCEIEVEGSGFLYNMVRIIAGTLAEVGRGRMLPGEIAELLAARDRRRAGPTLPPHGLCLQWVRYPEDPEVASD
jgi:tRNA pseudouridine38-40 synthase